MENEYAEKYKRLWGSYPRGYTPPEPPRPKDALADSVAAAKLRIFDGLKGGREPSIADLKLTGQYKQPKETTLADSLKMKKDREEIRSLGQQARFRTGTATAQDTLEVKRLRGLKDLGKPKQPEKPEVKYDTQKERLIKSIGEIKTYETYTDSYGYEKMRLVQKYPTVQVRALFRKLETGGMRGLTRRDIDLLDEPGVGEAIHGLIGEYSGKTAPTTFTREKILEELRRRGERVE